MKNLHNLIIEMMFNYVHLNLELQVLAKEFRQMTKFLVYS